jgi:hypothetical protein
MCEGGIEILFETRHGSSNLGVIYIPTTPADTCHALLEALSMTRLVSSSAGVDGHIEIKDSSKRGGSDWSNALLSHSQTGECC